MRKLADIFWRWAAAIIVAAIVLLATGGCATTAPAPVPECEQCRAWVREHDGVHYAIFTAEDLKACFEEVAKRATGECR